MKKLLLLTMVLLALLAYCCGDIMLGPGVQDFSVDLHNGYILCISSAHYVVIEKIGSKNGPTIPAQVVKMGLSKDYILAEQHPYMPKSSNDEQGISKLSPDQYWIIQIATNNVTGPLSKSDFDKEKERLGISINLVLKDISTYRPKN